MRQLIHFMKMWQQSQRNIQCLEIYVKQLAFIFRQQSFEFASLIHLQTIIFISYAIDFSVVFRFFFAFFFIPSINLSVECLSKRFALLKLVKIEEQTRFWAGLVLCTLKNFHCFECIFLQQIKLNSFEECIFLSTEAIC